MRPRHSFGIHFEMRTHKGQFSRDSCYSIQSHFSSYSQQSFMTMVNVTGAPGAGEALKPPTPTRSGCTALPRDELHRAPPCLPLQKSLQIKQNHKIGWRDLCKAAEVALQPGCSHLGTTMPVPLLRLQRDQVKGAGHMARSFFAMQRPPGECSGLSLDGHEAR